MYFDFQNEPRQMRYGLLKCDDQDSFPELHADSA